ncbi:hypothetical protein [Chitinilyticum piscinae]|uniref:Uncharacterized protein n=1 Tax=Chitinilyticum piscinae TaxID=2866724 RepID=A0A8J7G0H7_9NEIS|nr:hypothetical protein [Chitinilyticum piscinae]MBE9609725.1 hypothetical protein [Chitinilyticum piscinae]
MSYDLNFWKYADGVSADHQQVYEQLCEGLPVGGLQSLPIAALVADIAADFADGWLRVGESSWEGPQGAFTLTTSPQWLRVDCHGLSGSVMNRFIDLAACYGCPLYDPQTGVRYDG